MSKTYNKLLSELTINKIYHNFRKSIAHGTQLPLPFEFNDVFFNDHKEQIDYALRQMPGMEIGYEFEIYLPKQDDADDYIDYDNSSTELDYDNPEYTTEGFNNVESDFLGTLHEYFAIHNNSRAYDRLEKAYQKWHKDKMEDESTDFADTETKKWALTLEHELTSDDEEYIQQHIQFYHQNYKELEDDEDAFTLDDFINDQFAKIRYGRYNTDSAYDLTYDSALLNVVHEFDFEPDSEHSFDDDGYVITDVEYPELNNTNENNAHHNQLAEYLRDKLDCKVMVFNEYHDEIKNKKRWYIEPDGSLRDAPKNYFPVEVSTKTYPAPQFKEIFSDALKWFKSYDADGKKPVTNTTTGLHFSVSFTDSRPIDFLKLVVLGRDDFWLNKLGRTSNPYCQGQMEQLKRFISYRYSSISVNQDNIEDIIEDFTEHMDSYNMISTNQKTMSINFSKYKNLGYIEFRLLGNDYYGHPGTALKSIEWFLRILIAAATPDLFKTEYHQWIINEFAKNPLEVKLPKIK